MSYILTVIFTPLAIGVISFSHTYIVRLYASNERRNFFQSVICMCKILHQ